MRMHVHKSTCLAKRVWGTGQDRSTYVSTSCRPPIRPCFRCTSRALHPIHACDRVGKIILQGVTLQQGNRSDATPRGSRAPVAAGACRISHCSKGGPCQRWHLSGTMAAPAATAVCRIVQPRGSAGLQPVCRRCRGRRAAAPAARCRRCDEGRQPGCWRRHQEQSRSTWHRVEAQHARDAAALRDRHGPVSCLQRRDPRRAPNCVSAFLQNIDRRHLCSCRLI